MHTHLRVTPSQAPAYVPGDGQDEFASWRMILHTIPFAMLQVGLVVLSMSETVYGVGGYWARIGTSKWLGAASIVYCTVLIGACMPGLRLALGLGLSWGIMQA